MRQPESSEVARRAFPPRASPEPRRPGSARERAGGADGAAPTARRSSWPGRPHDEVVARGPAVRDHRRLSGPRRPRRARGCCPRPVATRGATRRPDTIASASSINRRAPDLSRARTRSPCAAMRCRADATEAALCASTSARRRYDRRPGARAVGLAVDRRGVHASRVGHRAFRGGNAVRVAGNGTRAPSRQRRRHRTRPARRSGRLSSTPRGGVRRGVRRRCPRRRARRDDPDARRDLGAPHDLAVAPDGTVCVVETIGIGARVARSGRVSRLGDVRAPIGHRAGAGRVRSSTPAEDAIGADPTGAAAEDGGSEGCGTITRPRRSLGRRVRARPRPARLAGYDQAGASRRSWDEAGLVAAGVRGLELLARRARRSAPAARARRGGGCASSRARPSRS